MDTKQEDREYMPTSGHPLLSDRSLKFYNGTYKWNSEGFEDEKGGTFNSNIYLNLDCLPNDT